MSDLVACFQVVGSDPEATDACIVFGFWAGGVVYVDFEVEGVTWGGDDLLGYLAVVILNAGNRRYSEYYKVKQLNLANNLQIGFEFSI